MVVTGEPVSRPLRRDAARNRQRIVDVARTLVDEQGLRVSHDEIARAADVGVGTVYRRFPHLDALFDEIFHDRTDAVVSLLEDAAALDDPWKALEAYMFGTCELQARNRGLDDFLLGRAGSLDYSRAAHARLAEPVSRLLGRAHAAGVIRPEIGQGDMAVVFALISALMKVAGRVDPDLWRRYLTLLLDGMRPGGASTTLPGRPPRGDDLHQILTGRSPASAPEQAAPGGGR